MFTFPFRDDVEIEKSPVVTTSIFFLNILIFCLTYLKRGPFEVGSLFDTYGFTPAEPHFLKIFSSMFLHGGFLHLAGNMLYLWVFGDTVEDRLGHIGFLIFYLLGGITSLGFHSLFTFVPEEAVIGASGAISGILGAYFVLYPRAYVDIYWFLPFVWADFFSLRALYFLGVWIGLQILLLFTSTAAQVALWAHIGGFIFGAGVGVGIKWRERKALTLEEASGVEAPSGKNLSLPELLKQAKEWEKKKKWDKAVKTYEEIIQNFWGEREVPECLYRVVKIYKGKLRSSTSAEKFYQKLLHAYPFSEWTWKLKKEKGRKTKRPSSPAKNV